MEHKRVAFDDHDFGVEVSDIDQNGRSVAILRREEKQRLAHRQREESRHFYAEGLHAAVDIVKEKFVGHDEGNERFERGALHTHRLHRLFAVVHRKPRGRTVDDDAAHGLDILIRHGKDALDVGGRDVRIDALQLQRGFRHINAAKLTGHAHVNFADAAVRPDFPLPGWTLKWPR